MGNNKKLNNKTIHLKGGSSFYKPLLIFLLFILLIISSYLLIASFTKKPQTPSKEEEFSKETKRLHDGSKEALNKTLKNKEYEKYQLFMSDYVSGYINAKQYKKARQALDEVKKNVPDDQIDVITYQGRYDLARVDGTEKEYENATDDLAFKLREMGDEKSAQYFEDEFKKSRKDE